MCRPPSNLLSFTRGVDYEVCHTIGTIEIATLPSYYSGRVVGTIWNGEPGFEARHNVDRCIRGTCGPVSESLLCLQCHCWYIDLSPLCQCQKEECVCRSPRTLFPRIQCPFRSFQFRFWFHCYIHMGIISATQVAIKTCGCQWTNTSLCTSKSKQVEY